MLFLNVLVLQEAAVGSFSILAFCVIESKLKNSASVHCLPAICGSEGLLLAGSLHTAFGLSWSVAYTGTDPAANDDDWLVRKTFPSHLCTFQEVSQRALGLFKNLALEYFSCSEQ